MKEVIIMKINSEELNKIWDDLQNIFLDFRGVNSKVIKDLNKIGIIFYGSKHGKIKLPNGAIITLSRSPSDIYAGRQILRRIRKVYENERNNEKVQK